RMVAGDQVRALLCQLRARREEKGLSLADLTQLTGMDRSAIAKLENGQRANPTIATLSRYARALGKRLVLSVEDVRLSDQPAPLCNTAASRRPSEELVTGDGNGATVV